MTTTTKHITSIIKSLADLFNNLDRKTLINTFDYGPFYNRLSPSDGLPILGDYLAPLERVTPELDEREIYTSAQAPEPGIVAVPALTGTPDGNIDFKTVVMPDRPALILPEDLLTIMALVFIDRLQPSVDMKSAVRYVQTSQGQAKAQFSKLTFTPDWLSATALGKTLYVTDRLLGETLGQSMTTVFNPLHAVEQADEPKPGLTNLAIDFAMSWHRSLKGNNEPSHLNIGSTEKQPDHIVERIANNHINIFLVEPDAKISSWQEKHGDDQAYNVDDTSKIAGNHATFLTERFDDLAALLPVYERWRQLLKIFTGVNELYRQGFRLNKDLENAVKDHREVCEKYDIYAEPTGPQEVYWSPIFSRDREI